MVKLGYAWGMNMNCAVIRNSNVNQCLWAARISTLVPGINGINRRAPEVLFIAAGYHKSIVFRRESLRPMCIGSVVVAVQTS